MLSRLKIQNLALVDDLELEFDNGMSVLTGETGAGKSVVVTALSLVLGERAEREYIRHGATSATVEATIQVDRSPRQHRDDFADYFEENKFTVTRVLSRDGASRVKINGTVSTLSRLKELTAPLAEILGQHASQMLIDEANHLRFLDRFASLDTLRDEVTQLYMLWQKSRIEKEQVKERRDMLVKERELLLFQQKEIEDTQVQVGEEEKLTNERRILDSSRVLMESAGVVQSILDSEEHGILDSLRLARKELDKMTGIDSSLAPQLEQLTELDYQLEDLRGFIEQYGSSVPDNPDRLEEINARLDELYNLKLKYGGSEEGILRTLQSIHNRLRDCPDIDGLISRLDQECEQHRAAYAGKAVTLSEVRRKAASYLQKLVVKELAELAIDNGGFKFEFVSEEDPDGIEFGERTLRPYPYGLENGSFLFSANPGEPLKSLVKTASGGEISRVLLALKSAEKKNNSLMRSLIVFDEVDAGIGGQVAIEVGRKLKKLSENCQVLVVTHLHQIARLADHHYVATKTAEHNDRAVINVIRLGQSDIPTELNRMVALPEEVQG